MGMFTNEQNHSKWLKDCFTFCSEPTYNDDLIVGHHPVQNNQINFLDITNDGLTLGVNPRQSAMEFWTRLEKQAQRLMNEQTKE